MIGNRGFTLIELLVALSLLSIAGLAAVDLGRGTLDALRRAESRERQQWDAERLLSAHLLLSRRGLERALGSRVVGDHTVTITRVEFDLFRVAVDDLAMSVYRPASADE